MELIEKVIELASTLHAGQTRVSGESYYAHLHRVATEVRKVLITSFGYKDQNRELYEAVIAAGYLHDCVEDGHITFDDLRAELSGLTSAKFVDIIIKIIDRVTRRKGENYFQFIRRIGTITQTEDYEVENLARIYAILVKICDINDNLGPTDSGSRSDKYRFAAHMLCTQSTTMNLGYTIPMNIINQLK